MSQTEQALLKNIHTYGAVLWEDLIRQFPGSGVTVQAAVRKNLLHRTNISGTRILSLGSIGRMHFGIKGNRPHAAATLLNQIAGRVLIDYYRQQGWTYNGKFSRHGFKFSHPEHANEFVFIKHNDYRHEYLHSVAHDFMTEALRNHAYLIYYARHATPADYARYSGQRITFRDFTPILQTAHPKVQALLEEAIV